MNYILSNGIILDGTKDMTPVSGKYVVIVDGKIADITDTKPVIENYEEIDLKGQYIVPGLINMHVHLPGSGKPQKKKQDSKKLVHTLMSNPITRKVAYNLCYGYAKTELMSGVTTIRTVGGIADFDTKIRDEINAGKKIGPRILASNTGVSVPGGHMAGSVATESKTVEDAVAYVEETAKQKVDLIKLMITGGVLDATKRGTPGEMKMPVEMIKACCDTAHANGFKVAAHVESTEGVILALQNGVDSIEHGGMPTDEMIQLFKEKGACLCTTLSPVLPYAFFDRSVSHISEDDQYNGQVVFEGVKECSKVALANDIPVALGNDVGCPFITHYDFWRELVYFVKFVGVTPQFALYSATLGNATIAGIGDKTGSIEVGKDADIIITKENPIENLRTLRNVQMVMAKGKLIKDPKVKRNAECDKELDPFLD